MVDKWLTKVDERLTSGWRAVDKSLMDRLPAEPRPLLMSAYWSAGRRRIASGNLFIQRTYRIEFSLLDDGHSSFLTA